MKIIIKETGITEELNIIDPKTSKDYSDDFICNHQDYYNGNTDQYEMYQRDFDWWEDIMKKYEAIDFKCYELMSDLSDRLTLKMKEELATINVDIEYIPGQMEEIFNKYAKFI